MKLAPATPTGLPAPKSGKTAPDRQADALAELTVAVAVSSPGTRFTDEFR